MSEGTEFIRMGADEFKRLVATGKMEAKRGTAHPQGARCTEDGINFDSKTERDFYRDLKAKELEHIDVHPVYTVHGERYTADFCTYDEGPIEV